jgi:hypothetical protein
MASQPLASWHDQAWSPAAPRPALRAVDVTPQLSPLEWSIVAMAERDSLATLRKPNSFWSLVGAIFAIKPANRLASDRLEALRRVSVLAWRYRWNVPQSELDAFFDAGYTTEQYEQLQSRIAGARAGNRRRTAR